MKFCLRCNREVLPDEILTEPIILVSREDVIGIDGKLIHHRCGGQIQSLLLE